MRKIIFITESSDNVPTPSGLKAGAIRNRRIRENELKSERLQKYEENRIRNASIKDADKLRKDNLSWLEKNKKRKADTEKAKSLAIYRMNKVNPNYGKSNKVSEQLPSASNTISIYHESYTSLSEEESKKFNLSVLGKSSDLTTSRVIKKGKDSSKPESNKMASLENNMSRANAIFFKRDILGDYLRALVLKEEVFKDEKDLEFLKFLESSEIMKKCIADIKDICREPQFNTDAAMKALYEFRSYFNEAKKQFNEN